MDFLWCEIFTKRALLPGRDYLLEIISLFSCIELSVEIHVLHFCLYGLSFVSVQQTQDAICLRVKGKICDFLIEFVKVAESGL